MATYSYNHHKTEIGVMNLPHSCSTEASLKTYKWYICTQTHTIPSVHTYAHRALISEDRLRRGGGTEGHIDLRKTSPMVIMKGYSLQGAWRAKKGLKETDAQRFIITASLLHHWTNFVAFHLWILRLNVMQQRSLLNTWGR